MRAHRNWPHRQRGVAVVTALLLTTLAITIVASLFWQQQVQVRSIENQRFQLQKKWVLRGALDWAGLILREDQRTSQVDHLGEPWAVNLGETRLDQYVENGRSDSDDSDASLTGQISDAQAKFNLTNLANNGVVDPHAVAIFARLLSNLRLDPSAAVRVAQQVALTQDKLPATDKAGDSTKAGADNPGATSGGIVGPVKSTSSDSAASSPQESRALLSANLISEVQFLRFSQIEDLLSVPGFSLDSILKLRNYVTVLPVNTKVNVNTTSPEVLSALFEHLSTTEAALMIAARDRAYFLDFANFKQSYSDKVPEAAGNDVDFKTSYFVINGKVRLNHSLLEVNALIERNGQKTQVLWIKEN